MNHLHSRRVRGAAGVPSPATVGAWVLCLAVAASALAGEEPSEARRLYDEFEGLHTVENLTIRFVGGEPVPFVKHQIELLQAIAARPAAEGAPFLIQIANQHIERIEGIGAAAFRTSPLQALQTPLIDALARFASSEEVRGALGRIVQCPLIKEYARGRALDVVLEYHLGQALAADDPKGEKRASLVQETLIGNLTLSELLHAPGRVRAVARRAPVVAKANEAAWRALDAAADSAAKHYAADAALAIACTQKDAAGTALVQAETELLLDACSRWLKDYRPIVAKEKYPSDLLGHSLMRLAVRPGHDNLAKLFRDSGVKPVP